MRITTRLGLGLLVVGAVAILVSSGAFDSIEADRGTNVETTTDEEALLGIEYPRLNDPEFDSIDLSGGSCAFFQCNYDGVDILIASDNTDGETMEDLSVSATVEGDDLADETQGEEWPETDGQIEDGPVTVTGDFDCPAVLWSQIEASATVDTTLEVTGNDGLSIVLSREIQVNCT